MSIDVEDYWAKVPSVDDAPVEGRRPSFEKARATRRTVLKSVGALGGALALNVVGALPFGGAKPAEASVGTEWYDCAGYNNWSGYDNNTTWCVGGPYSRDYCGGDGWFLRLSMTCFVSGPTVACGTGSYSHKNAWRWTHNGTPYRCADGYQQSCGSSSVFRICSWSWP
ncbi:hypothetical protein [Streptosporangium sp. NPDC000396]|uniref:hypothetical protein n=1 Tax=Streptosporangium sp. NPDC000396 TaxID=3366185 RepID=UPI0036A86B69